AGFYQWARTKQSLLGRPHAQLVQRVCNNQMSCQHPHCLLRSRNSPMPHRDFLAELQQRVLVFDGSMGANLQDLELTADDFGGARYEGCMDALCRTRPDAPARLHRGFLTAG